MKKEKNEKTIEMLKLAIANRSVVIVDNEERKESVIKLCKKLKLECPEIKVLGMKEKE